MLALADLLLLFLSWLPTNTATHFDDKFQPKSEVLSRHIAKEV